MENKKYIISRNAQNFPESRTQLENDLMYNSWFKLFYPFNDLNIGDILYWYNSKSKKIIWKTKVYAILKVEYSSKKELESIFKIIPSLQYFNKSAALGYFLGYKVKFLKRLNISVPTNFRMPQIGWYFYQPEIEKIINSSKDNS